MILYYSYLAIIGMCNIKANSTNFSIFFSSYILVVTSICDPILWKEYTRKSQQGPVRGDSVLS